ncbi:hypothetical protein DY000_02032209 [Brassica cretica]|uniref:Uncharacterized protein n=1 Tax=Brassica cretica TaxID=69181 RepID=A0ABQ7DNK9_BRACR|nr:hypothetical protein DY000_02032209 [Brassica cretica]
MISIGAAYNSCQHMPGYVLGDLVSQKMRFIFLAKSKVLLVFSQTKMSHYIILKLEIAVKMKEKERVSNCCRKFKKQNRITKKRNLWCYKKSLVLPGTKRTRGEERKASSWCKKHLSDTESQ